MSLDVENNQCVLAGKVLGLVLCLLDCPPIIFITSLTIRLPHISHQLLLFLSWFIFSLTIPTPGTLFLKVISDLQICKSNCYSSVFIVSLIVGFAANFLVLEAHCSSGDSSDSRRGLSVYPSLLGVTGSLTQLWKAGVTIIIIILYVEKQKICSYEDLPNRKVPRPSDIKVSFTCHSYRSSLHAQYPRDTHHSVWQQPGSSSFE